MKILVKLVGLPDFKRFQRESNDFSAMLNEIAIYRSNAFRISISANRDALGKPVAKLSERYARYKFSKVGSKPIRVFSKNGMVTKYKQRINKLSVTEIIDSPIATFHQTGTSRMPKRQLLPRTFEEIPKYGKDKITQIMRKHYKRALNKK